MLTDPPSRDHVDVLVVGAGYVGGAAARLLADQGRVVAAVRRSPEDADDGVHWITADVTTPAGRAALPSTADAVVCSLSPDARDVDAYRRAYVDVPTAVVDHLAARPSRVLLTTSTAVYGQDDGGFVDEASPTDPDRETAQVLVEAEKALRDLAPWTTSLRLGGIYGPGRTRLVDQVRAGEADCAKGQWTNRIHRDDAASAIAHVLGLAQPPPIVNVVDDTPVERCDVLAWLAHRLGAPDPTRDHDHRRARGTAKRVDNRLLRSTGWAPAFPSWREGYADMLAGGA